MMRGLLFLAVAAGAVPAAAAPIQFSALVRGDLGYGTNPFLQTGVTGGAAFASVTVSPKLTYATARSTTELDTSYTRYQYFSNFGYTDTLSASLQRTDQLNAFLSSTLTASYSSTDRALVSGPTALIANDPLNIGRRTRLARGSYQLQWQASAADRFTYGAEIDHLSYGGGGAFAGAVSSNYTEYAVNGGYDHTFDARTSGGVAVSLSTNKSHFYPDSRVIEPSVHVRRQLNAVWVADAHVGVILEKTYGPLTDSSASLGYGGSLCGTYPRRRLCLTVDRSTAPSGFGGLRTDTNVTASMTQEVTEHDHLSLNASYYRSSSPFATGLPVIGSSDSVQLNEDYDHDLTQRLSAGFGGSYQWRRTAGYGSARAVSGSIHISAKLGRL